MTMCNVKGVAHRELAPDSSSTHCFSIFPFIVFVSLPTILLFCFMLTTHIHWFPVVATGCCYQQKIAEVVEIVEQSQIDTDITAN